MKTHKLAILLSIALLGVFIPFNLVHAQDIAAIFAKAFKVDGHWEYNEDGVPILGLIIKVINPSRVEFKFCSNKTKEIDRAQLTQSTRKCEPPKKPDDIWTGLVPLIKTKSDERGATVTFQGKNIDLTKLPGMANYTATVTKAKPGDWVGYVFTAEDGSKSAAILETPVQ